MENKKRFRQGLSSFFFVSLVSFEIELWKAPSASFFVHFVHVVFVFVSVCVYLLFMHVYDHYLKNLGLIYWTLGKGTSGEKSKIIFFKFPEFDVIL